jgi:8-oxo-dGTP pyrophosphatase MutT (NUDIX family)
VYNENGQVLWGRRQKDGAWTLPGGHLEPGEEPAEGAVRELLEEAGIVPESVNHFGTANTPDGVPVFMFSAHVHDQQPHGRFDPDHEVADWQWVDCLMGVPPEIRQHLAHPRNVVLEHLGW